MMMMMMMVRVVLLVLALTASSDAILPEIVDSGISHILEDNIAQGQTELDRMLVEVEQLREDPQPKPEDAFHQETNNISTTTVQYRDLGNSVDHGCVTNEDCGTGRYCLYDTPNPKCLTCKAIDVPCTKDEECCGEHLCVWGQCSQNATKGEPGTTCQHQADCRPDLCCAFHKALLFPVCLTKPIERERCFGASNHLMELLSWKVQDEGPRKHCPCAGNLHCQHLGRGSMCLEGKDSSEEELADTLYSGIDYII
ncbi:dickkopf-related protein 3a isoform X2 [Anabas testudineus]|uniref:dickkopf-related protein 3a isoform X2 n=1 Tax=Anabas testudineus TaxID=64144 RepID=UPI000E465E5A|nr:dickkopf-related protein 3a isoform X2 [Anabas testudineus]